MEQFHYHPAPLDRESGTTALWAASPNRTLLIFVHGFGGSATDTWVEFPNLLSSSSKARHCDCIFYGYDGLRTRAYISALKLLAFLKGVCTQAAEVVNSTLPQKAARRPLDFTFSKVVIVAHSLGAIVSRQALLSAHKSGAPWANSVELVFFAPAHSGADALLLAGEALSGLPYLKSASAAGKAYAQVLLDLERNSQLLTKLKSEVERALPNAPNLAAKRVILAENDRIIDPSPFIAEDPDPAHLILGRGHMDVCKPHAKFRDPVAALEELL